jgi:hypothetical protein
MWRQRSRIEWFSEGGKNTRFFHLRTSQRKKKNKICRLLRPDGVATENDQELADLRASPAVPRLGPRRPFFTSGRWYSSQSRFRFLVFPRIWALIHPVSPGHPRSPGARSGTPDERKAGMGPLCR